MTGETNRVECPEETLEVRLRSTETRSTYNIVVEVEGVIDVHYASLTSQWVQHRVFYRDGHPSRYQPRPTGLNFSEQTGTGIFPLVTAVPLQEYFISRSNVTAFSSSCSACILLLPKFRTSMSLPQLLLPISLWDLLTGKLNFGKLVT